MDFLGRQAHAGILSNQREQILSCLVVLVLALLWKGNRVKELTEN